MTLESALEMEFQASDAAERVARLFDRHHQYLFGLARRLGADGQTAEDLVQETYLRVLRRPERVPEGKADEQRWLVRILVNLCRDQQRHRKMVAAKAHHLEKEAAAPDPESSVVAKRTVQVALTRLPARRRAVILLVEIEGRSIEETARLLGISGPTVRWHLWTGRRELTKALTRKLSRPDEERR